MHTTSFTSIHRLFSFKNKSYAVSIHGPIWHVILDSWIPTSLQGTLNFSVLLKTKIIQCLLMEKNKNSTVFIVMYFLVILG